MPAGSGSSSERQTKAAKNKARKDEARQQQNRIIFAPANQDLLIVAGAGSGKTHAMTERIITLIKRDHIDPNRILGLTFTRKAAAELLSRVTKEVAAAADPSDSSVDRDFMHPQVFTYDAFFQSIVRQYGALVGMSSDTVPLSQAGRYQLASEVVSTHIRPYIADMIAEDDDASSSASSSSSSSGGQGQEADSSQADDQGSYATLVKDVLALSAELSNSMISPDCPGIKEAVDQVSKWDQAFLDLVDRYAAQADSEADSGTGREEDKKPLDSRLLNIQKATRRRQMLLEMVLAYDQAKKDQSLAEFSDFTIAAFQLALRYPWIRSEYREKFSHVFLDEYQDTSTTQAKLLTLLFHDPLPGAESAPTYVTAVGDPYQSIYAWRGASPGAFSLFLKDYGMKEEEIERMSYTWRNPALVLDAANRLTNPIRSDRADPLRQTSAITRQEVSVDQLSYIDSKDDATVGLIGYPTVAQEADGIARFAHEAIKQAHRRVDARKAAHGFKSEEEYRAEYSKTHVALLLRAKTHRNIYCQALSRLGLTYEIAGDQSLWDRPDSQDLLALLSLVTDHTDSASALRLLATDRFGLSKNDLSVLSYMAQSLDNDYKRQALQQLTDQKRQEGNGTGQEVSDREFRQLRGQLPTGVYLTDLLEWDDFPDSYRQWADSHRETQAISQVGLQQIAKASAMIRDLDAHLDQPIEDVVSYASKLLTLDIDASVSQAIAQGRAADTPSRSCLSAFQDLAQTYAREIADGQSATLTGFVAWLTANKENPTDEFVGGSVLSDNPDVVVMTVHQAKGLQWDAVAVGGMGAQTFPSNQGDRLAVSLLPHCDSQGKPTDCDYASELVTSSSQSSDYVLKPGVWDGSFMTGRQKTYDRATRAYRNPDYFTQSRTWLTAATAVPAPVRSDRDLLPAFPDAANLAEAFPTWTDLERAVFDSSQAQQVKKANQALSKGKQSYRAVVDNLYQAVARKDIDAVNFILNRDEAGKKKPTKDTLTVAEGAVAEALSALYGRGREETSSSENKGERMSLAREISGQLLEDERRLAYVALTRTEHDLFLTFSEHQTDPFDPHEYDRVHFAQAGQALGDGASISSMRKWVDNQALKLESTASVFWLELFSRYSNPETCPEDYAVCPAEDPFYSNDSYSQLPMGLFLGGRAELFRSQVVDQALRESEQARIKDPDVVWPQGSASDDLVDKVLAASAGLVQQRIRELTNANSADQVPDDRQSRQEQTLTAAARRLVADRAQTRARSLQPSRVSPAGQIFTSAQQTGIVYVTAIQKSFAAHLQTQSDGGKDQKSLRSSMSPGSGSAQKKKKQTSGQSYQSSHDLIYRPMPRANSLQAQHGTEFHEWAQEFILPSSLSSQGEYLSGQAWKEHRQKISREVAQEVSRITNLMSAPAEGGQTDVPQLLRWKNNLLHSVWAGREAWAAEQSITDTIEGGDGSIYHLRGSLDAVFYGRLNDDPNNPTENFYTIVDWKTGHKPGRPAEKAEKLAQLDIYRLMLSDLLGIDIDQIEAQLYYLDEDRQEDRPITCPMRSRNLILSSLQQTLKDRLATGILDDADDMVDPDSNLETWSDEDWSDEEE